MPISWGYLPKTEKRVSLNHFDTKQYLALVCKAIENLGWKLSHLAADCIVAYTPFSWQSHSEEIIIKIYNDFHGGNAIAQSQCVGIQMLFNDYGKNHDNLEKLFLEMEYAEFQLKNDWEAYQTAFEAQLAHAPSFALSETPLALKQKIKRLFDLFIPQEGYVITPILMYLNFFSIGFFMMLGIIFTILSKTHPTQFPEGSINYFISFISKTDRNEIINGGYWRLIYIQFSFVSFFHLLLKLYLLSYVGLMIERKLGWQFFLFIFLASGICGILSYIMVEENNDLQGTFASIAGLYGAYLALLLNQLYEKNANKALLKSTIAIVTLFFIVGFINVQVDKISLFAGFLAGFILCYPLCVKSIRIFYQLPRLRNILSISLFIVFFAAVMVFIPKYDTEEFNKLNTSFDENVTKFNGIIRLSISLPKEEKLAAIDSLGLVPTKANKEIVKKMIKLNLSQKDIKIRDKKIKLCKVSEQAVNLMYRDIKADSLKRYSQQTSAAIADIYKILNN